MKTVIDEFADIKVMRFEIPGWDSLTLRQKEYVTLYNLQRQQKIFRIGYDAYTILKPNHLPEYHPIYSDTASTISRKISDKYQDIDFVATESVLLNEFLNHQIAQNTVYVHIEKEISSLYSIFCRKIIPAVSYISQLRMNLTVTGQKIASSFWI